jgi:hypothetical protein
MAAPPLLKRRKRQASTGKRARKEELRKKERIGSLLMKDPLQRFTM